MTASPGCTRQGQQRRTATGERTHPDGEDVGERLGVVLLTLLDVGEREDVEVDLVVLPLVLVLRLDRREARVVVDRRAIVVVVCAR
jgi:hypothetical protein